MNKNGIKFLTYWYYTLPVKNVVTTKKIRLAPYSSVITSLGVLVVFFLMFPHLGAIQLFTLLYSDIIYYRVAKNTVQNKGSRRCYNDKWRSISH